MPAEELSDCEALDVWMNRKTTTPSISYVKSSVPAGSFPTGFLTHPC